jgi:hypothetical protein
MTRDKVDNMIQSAVRLPRRLHERLKKVGGEGGMGEEIRRRLEASFDEEDAERRDPKTRELLEAISFAAGQATSFFGSWSKDAFAFRVLEASVDLLLKHYQPEGEPKPNPTELGEIIFGKNRENENLSPEEVSRTVVSLWLRSEAIVGQKG